MSLRTEIPIVRLAIEYPQVREMYRLGQIPLRHCKALMELILTCPLGTEPLLAAVEEQNDPNLSRLLQDVLGQRVVIEDFHEYLKAHEDSYVREEVARRARRMLWEARNAPVEALRKYVPSAARSDTGDLVDASSLLSLYEKSLTAGRLTPPIRLGLNRDYESFWDGYRMILVMADTKHGKSTFLSQSAFHTMQHWLAEEMPYKLIFFCLEGGLRRLFLRFLALASGIPRKDWEPGRVIAPEVRLKTYEAVERLPILASEERNWQAMQDLIMEVASTDLIGAIYIDYIQMMGLSKGEAVGEESLRQMANELVELGDKLNISIVVASQITNKNPFGARAILHKANLGLFLHKLGDTDARYRSNLRIEYIADSLDSAGYAEEVFLDYATGRIQY